MAITNLEAMSGSQTNINTNVSENIARLNNNGVGFQDLRNLKSFYYVSTSSSFTVQYGTGERQYIAVSSASALTITLPPTSAAPTNGFMVIIADTTRNSETYNITIERNGNTISGGTSNLTIKSNGSCVWLVYSGSNNYDLMFQGLTDTLIPVNTSVDLGSASNPFRYGFFDSIDLNNTVAGTQLVITKSKTSFGPDIYLRSSRDGSTATQAGDLIGSYYAMGHSGSAYFSPTGGIVFSASQNFTGSAAGTDLNIQLCPASSTTLNNIWTIRAGAVLPTTTANEDLGSGSNEIDNIYLVNAPIVSSDPRVKRDLVSFESIGLDPLNFLEKLNNSNAFVLGKRKNTVIPTKVYELVSSGSYRYELEDYDLLPGEISEPDFNLIGYKKVFDSGKMGKFLRDEIIDYTAQEGEFITPGKTINHNRNHSYIMADTLYKILKELNVSSMDFAGLIINGKNSFDKDGNVIETEEGLPVGKMGIRYEEFIPVALSAIAQLSEKVRILESKLGI
jgi:hypothetical protein